MSTGPWWNKPYQPHSAEAARSTAPIKECEICGKFAKNRCSKCSSVGYCGRECQVKHWSEHKKHCASLKARALAAAQAKPKLNHVTPTSASAPAAAAPAAPPSNSAIPIATTELYPYETFIKNWNSISLSGQTPCGLYNLGNTCYINAILQVLLATRPLVAYLLTNEHTCPSPAATSLYLTFAKKHWCPLCCLVSLAQEVFQNSKPPSSTNNKKLRNSTTKDPLSIRNITHSVHHLNSSFTFGDQHDAQELYVALLDAIECVSLREVEAKSESGVAATAALDQFSKQTTLMNHVFTCYTRTQVECTMCGQVSKSYTSETGIMLSVPEERKNAAYSLENLLANFTAVEILQGDDAYRCDACCARVKAHKSNVIEVAPNILAIQLSRVGMNVYSTGAQKNSAAVEFPVELDLTPFLAVDAVDAAPAVYDLYAVVTHEGSTTEDGHYISVVRYGGDDNNNRNKESDDSAVSDDSGSSQSSLASPLDSNKPSNHGHWYVCDDDIVSPLSVDILSKQQEEAYLLFYERRQPRVLAGSRGGDGVQSNTSTATAAVNGSPLAEISIEKLAMTPVAEAEVKPRAANGTEQGEIETETEEEIFQSYVFEMENNEKNGGRVLRLKVALPGVDVESTLEPPEIDFKPGKPVFAEVRCDGCCVLRMPIPVQVALPAKEVEWKKGEKILEVLFDAL